MSLVSDEKLYADMEAIVGKENISTDLYDRIAYAIDPMPYDLEDRNIPRIVVKPGSAYEVSEILRYANKHKIPVYTHGSGTLFNGASRPKRRGSIVMHMGRINFINIDEENMYFECGAGARVIEVETALLARGYMLPLNPGSKLIASMGGVISSHTVGHMVEARVGKPISHILGLEVVLPTGEIIETGTRSLGLPSGIDLTRLFVGGEGQFGVITKIRMKLIPDPKKVYVVAYFEKPEQVAKAFMNMYWRKAPLPLYGEFLDQETATIGCKLKDLPPPKGSVALAIATGYTQEEAIRNADELRKAFSEVEGYIESSTIEDPVLCAKIWGTREAILHVIGEHKASWVAIEVVPELKHLADAFLELKRTVTEGEGLTVLKGLKAYLYGHMGACSIHSLWIIPREWPNDLKKQAAIEAFKVERTLTIKYGGCCRELGHMASRVALIRQKYGETYYSILRRLKDLFDPNYILNPGNIEGEMG